MPDGQLVGRERNEVEATQKPFVPLTHDEIAESIIEESGLSGFRVETTENFVVIYNTSPEFAEVTAKVMQTMLDGVLKYTQEQGIDTKVPDIPLPVIAFHTAGNFNNTNRCRLASPPITKCHRIE